MGLLAAFVLVLLLFGWQALRATSSLRLAANQAELLQNQIVDGNDSGAKQTLAALTQSTERARKTTDGFLWDVGSKVPVLGKNIGAVQTVADVLDQVATQALPPVVALSSEINLKTFSPKDGKIDIPAIQEIAPSVAVAEKALVAADQRVKDIDPDSLLVPLRGPVSTVQAKVGGARSAAVNGKLASELLPTMLGGKETRRYLLLVQNNAESRSTGGITGSFAILTAKKGKLSMGFQGSYGDLQQFDSPVLPMTKEESALFPPTMVTNILDTNTTPDFPRTAEIARAMVKKGRDVDVDGVISVDPVAMAYILAGTGPIPAGVPGVFFDQTNAVDILLNGIYRQLDIAQQDEAFKIAARSIFDVVKSGAGDPRLVIKGLVQGAEENRVMVWSSHPEEQGLLGPSELSGALSGDAGATPHIGVYLGDAASGKMEYYLDATTSAAATRCLPGKIQEFTTTTQLTSEAPGNAAKLPESIVGLGKFTPKGTMKLIVRLYSPYAGGFTEVSLDGKPQTVYADTQLGRNVTRLIVTIKPGETHTITTKMISGKGQDRDVVVSTTPGVRPAKNDVVVASACS